MDRNFNDYCELSTMIANTVFGDIQKKQDVRKIILMCIAEAVQTCDYDKKLKRDLVNYYNSEVSKQDKTWNDTTYC